MELVTGVKKKETLELRELLEAGRIGTEVRVNGAIHTIRDMGTVAFHHSEKKRRPCAVRL